MVKTYNYCILFLFPPMGSIFFISFLVNYKVALPKYWHITSFMHMYKDD